ncbi:hypothetical protein Trydic_g8336 [Trypoxylus dichotomus]
MLYAAPVWGGALRKKKSRKLVGAQRVHAVRAARVYVTMSAEVAATISGILPADIRTRELANRRNATTNGEGVIMVTVGREIHSGDVEIRRRLVSEIHISEVGTIKVSKDAEDNHV